MRTVWTRCAQRAFGAEQHGHPRRARAWWGLAWLLTRNPALAAYAGDQLGRLR